MSTQFQQEDPLGQPNRQYAVNDLYDMSPLVLGDLRAFLEQNPGRWPVAGSQLTGKIDPSATIDASQVTGLTGAIANTIDYVTGNLGTNQTTTSATYTGATGFPTLSGLAAGTYLVGYGGTGRTTAATSRLQISVSIDGATASDDDRTGTNVTSQHGLARFCKATLATGTLGLQFRSTAGDTVELRDTWLVAVRIL